MCSIVVMQISLAGRRIHLGRAVNENELYKLVHLKLWLREKKNHNILPISLGKLHCSFVFVSLCYNPQIYQGGLKH